MILIESHREYILELNDLGNPLLCCVLQITMAGRYSRTKHARVQGDKEIPHWGKKHPRTSVCFFSYISVVIILNLGGGTHNEVIIQMCYVKDSWWTTCIKVLC